MRNVSKFSFVDFGKYESISAAWRKQFGVSRLTIAQAAEAKALVAKHIARKANAPKIINSITYPKNRIVKKQENRRHTFALAIGRAFHANVSPLSTSSRGDCVYGVGGQEMVDYDAYAKSYGYPARWKEGGARLEGNEIILETSRGKEVARIAIDFNTTRINDFVFDKALLHGDVAARKIAVGQYERLKIQKGRLVISGYVTKQAGVDGKEYYEHGATIEECRAEAARKIEVAKLEQKRIKLSGRNLRAARLLARISTKLVADFNDARAVGHCRAGIETWCQSRGIDINGSVPVSILMKDSDARARIVALRIAQNCIANRATVGVA